MKHENKQSNPSTTPRTERKPATPEKAKRTPAQILQAYEKAQKVLQDLQTQEQSKATARKIAAAEKRLAPLAKAVDDCGIITAFTVQTMGERIAGKLLKTIYSASGDTMIKRLFDGLIIDKNVRFCPFALLYGIGIKYGGFVALRLMALPKNRAGSECYQR